MPQMILSVDIGTSSLKAALISLKGRLHSMVRIPCSTIPSRRHIFRIEQWEAAFHSALKTLAPTRIQAISLSGNGPTVMVCDSSGKPISPVNHWIDNKQRPLPGYPSYYLPKLAWLHENSPEPWAPGSQVQTCPEWLQFKLTGNAEMGLPCEHFRSCIWDKEQIAAYGFQNLKFPELRPLGSIAGYIRAREASHYGLPEGIPVVLAGSDFIVALLGSGTISPGQACDRTGTSEAINLCTKQPLEPQKAPSILQAIPHVIEPYWNIAANLPSTGASFEWYLRVTAQQNRSWQDIMADIESLPMDENIPSFLPGPHPSAFWHFPNSAFMQLKGSHSSAHMGRAIMHSIGFAVLDALESLKQTGWEAGEMRTCGGQAHCMYWNQMKADISGCDILIPRIVDAELLGGACCAAYALGYFDSLVEASEKYVQIERRLQPRAEYSNHYKEAYQSYMELSRSQFQEAGLSEKR